MTTYSSLLAWRLSMDRGSWWVTVHGVARSQTALSDWAHTCTHLDQTQVLLLLRCAGPFSPVNYSLWPGSAAASTGMSPRDQQSKQPRPWGGTWTSAIIWLNLWGAVQESLLPYTRLCSPLLDCFPCRKHCLKKLPHSSTSVLKCNSLIFSKEAD